MGSPCLKGAVFQQPLGDRQEGACHLMGGMPEALFHQLMENRKGGGGGCKWQGTEHSHPEVWDHSLVCIQVVGCPEALLMKLTG